MLRKADEEGDREFSSSTFFDRISRRETLAQ
jgi:hypothetical protein